MVKRTKLKDHPEKAVNQSQLSAGRNSWEHGGKHGNPTNKCTMKKRHVCRKWFAIHNFAICSNFLSNNM